MSLDLTSARVLKGLMAVYGIRADRRLGQNFLTSQSTLEAICSAADLAPGSLVLEIGPGLGTLTQALLERGVRVLAVEVDCRLVEILKNTFNGAAGLEIVHADALKLDLAALLAARLAPGERAKVVANLPYYITTPILMRFLEEPLPLERVVVMVQREVAERMVASPGGKAYGALSVAVQYYSDAELALAVPAGSFWPTPEVDSAVVVMRLRAAPPVQVPAKPFFRVVRAAFSQRRKTLLNALAAGLSVGKERAAAICAGAGIDGQRRGETLSLQEFASLAEVAGEN